MKIEWTKRLETLARRIKQDTRRADIGLYASSGAYHLFLSLGPLTALILAILPYTSVTEQTLLDAVSTVAPTALGHLVHAVAQDIYAAPRIALGISLAAELWGAAKLLSCVVRGVCELADGRTAGYFRLRLLGAGYTLILIAFILGNLTLLLFGQRLAAAVQRQYPSMEALCRVLLALRPLIFLGGLASVNTLLYRCAPGKERTLPGAAAAALIWLLFTRVYSAALEQFGFFGVYGSIAAVIVTLYWAYCSLYILFLGAWLNRLIPDK